MTVRAGGFIAAAAVLATLVSGCSTSDDDQVRTALAEYLDEVGEQDYREACDLLEASTRQRQGRDCPAALSKRYADLSAAVRSDLDKIQIDRVTVKGSTATITDRNIEVVQTVRTTKKDKNGKKKTTTSTSRHTAPDLSSGNGFTLVKSGDNWLVSDGI
ncbi:hypothetical protein [Cryptosporangium minutisporangium]|uniref:Nuclear transport factor 2 family protein n=1 Tax=Cryptosporangium minutisporangium TaxID=113569 RepID=A0ABP6T7W1_9ACTN